MDARAARGGLHGRRPDVALAYLGSTLAYAALALLVFLWRVHPPAAAWRDMIFPREPQRRMALIALWNTPSMGLLPVVLMSSPLVVAGRIAAIRIAGFAVTFSLFALLASPIVAAVKLAMGVENDASYVPAVAAAVEREWKSQTDRPLGILTGPFGLASSVAFTLKDRPSTYADFAPYLSPWVNAEALMHKGLAVVCPGPRCGLHGAVATVNRQASGAPAGGPRVDAALARIFRPA
jgi:hypothetical protein